jgi:hypothetical protein
MRTGNFFLIFVGSTLSFTGCTVTPIVPIAAPTDYSFQERDARLLSVEVRMPPHRDRRNFGAQELLFTWRQDLETLLRDKRVFRSSGGRELRLVMTPLAFSETGVMSNVQITMDYSFIDASSGEIIERYVVESSGYSGSLNGITRSRDAWQIATSSNTSQFLRRFASREVTK